MADSSGENVGSAMEKLNNDDSVDDEVTMMDILEQERELEEETTAVLGGSDDQNCTYPLGHLKRQALYACNTCMQASEEKQLAGICLACTYECHEGHDLLELYTKRNFKCDCGNSKFENLTCKLVPKDKPCSENRYNQNFRGFYCICSRPYPDLEDKVPDQMIQCIICEDWYHGRHLGAPVPGDEEYQEMTCETCMHKHEFLWLYAPSSNVVKIEKAETDSVVNVEEEEVSSSTNTSNCRQGAGDNNINNTANDCKVPSAAASEAECKPAVNESSRDDLSESGLQNENCVSTSQSSEDQTVPRVLNSCQSNSSQEDIIAREANGGHSDASQDNVLAAREENGSQLSSSQNDVGSRAFNGGQSNDERPSTSQIKKEDLLYECKKPADKLPGKGAVFWISNWRERLCRCITCLGMYDMQGVSYLIDPEDTVHNYEQRGQARRDSRAQDSVVDVLQKVMPNRIHQLEAIHGYNDLKVNLTEYLRQFAENKKTVRESDIQEFFAQMNERKRARLEPQNSSF